MPAHRKSLEQHMVDGTYRADRHGPGGKYALGYRPPRFFPSTNPPEPEPDYLDEALQSGCMPESFWTRELVTRSITVTELAQEAGLSRETVSRLVNGRRPGWPSTRRKIVEALRNFEVLFEYDHPEDAA